VLASTQGIVRKRKGKISTQILLACQGLASSSEGPIKPRWWVVEEAATVASTLPAREV